MEIIQFKGVSELSSEDQDTVKSLSTEYYLKIKRGLHNITSLELHVKAHSKRGGKSKYSIHLRAIAPTRILEAQDDDWDLARTLHKVFRNMENEIKKVFDKESYHKSHKP